MNAVPPKRALQFLRWFCHEDYLEEIEGDLIEVFKKQYELSQGKAKWKFGWSVIKYLRPEFMKSFKPWYQSNLNYMYKSYFKIGWRNLVKNKGYSVINIGGLTLGIAVTMLIGIWVNDELSYDTHNKNYNRVAQVMQHQTANDYRGTGRAIPLPLGLELQKSYEDDFKYIVLSSWMGEHILAFSDKKFSKRGNYMDIYAPYLLDLRMVKGTLDGLREKHSIMLSQSVADALFGNKEPINEFIKIDNNLDVKVTGVYEDLPPNSSFKDLTFIAPWELFVSSVGWAKEARDQVQWDNNSFQLFVQLEQNADFEKLDTRLKNTIYDNLDDSERGSTPEVFLHPLKDWHLRTHWENGIHTGGTIQYVWLFGIVGIFVLLLACINFMNLSTARSEKRAKEVGIRKAMGSRRDQLISQFLSESFLVVVLAFLLAIVIVLILIPSFNDLANKKMFLPLASLSFWTICFLFILISGFLAGSYPAFYLSSFRPIEVLKGIFRIGRFASMPRKVLVVLQFTVSVTLIIGTFVVYRQIQLTTSRDSGYDRNGIIMMQMNSPDFIGKYEMLRNELKNSGAIDEMAESSSPLTNVWNTQGGVIWQGKDPELQAEFGVVRVTHEFGKTVGWKIKEGRDFSRDFPSDSSGFIINEASVNFMGLKDPIGAVVSWEDAGDQDFHIIGVVQDMLMESPYEDVRPTIYLIDYEAANWMELKLNSNASISESLPKVERVFKKYLPEIPFEYQFVDQEYAGKFASLNRIGRLSGIFASLAIIISCLGLFGLASFVAEQRKKEIAIRKILGASVTHIWNNLSREFVLLVLISSLVSTPFAYYFLSNWLKIFEYRTEVSWWIFVFACIVALIVTLLTVSFQAIMAARANPARSLKSE